MLPQAGYAAFGGRDDVRGLKKRNPLARFLARHGASLSVLLLLTLGVVGVGYHRQASSCKAQTAKLHASITELQNEHGAARASGDATAQQVAAMQRLLDDARRELAATRAASAERDKRLAEAEAAAHGHAATAHGASAETEALRSRADTLALSLAAAERERDEARHSLEAERALHQQREAEWKAHNEEHHPESYGGHHGDGDDDHTGFLQVAKLLDDQGVKHPKGHRAMASSLARFFEDEMATAMAAAERGEHVADVPSHDVSTKLISHLSHSGVTSAHGVEHLFQTVDHLVDAALTHWRPPSASMQATQPDGGHHGQEQHHGHEQAHHDAHAQGHHEQSHHEQQHHQEHGHVDAHAQGHHGADQHHAGAVGGHVDGRATGDPHHAPPAHHDDPHASHGHGQQQHHEEHHRHKVDSSGFVM